MRRTSPPSPKPRHPIQPPPKTAPEPWSAGPGRLAGPVTGSPGPPPVTGTGASRTSPRSCGGLRTSTGVDPITAPPPAQAPSSATGCGSSRTSLRTSTGLRSQLRARHRRWCAGCDFTVHLVGRRRCPGGVVVAASGPSDIVACPVCGPPQRRSALSGQSRRLADATRCPAVGRSCPPSRSHRPASARWHAADIRLPAGAGSDLTPICTWWRAPSAASASAGRLSDRSEATQPQPSRTRCAPLISPTCATMTASSAG